jgi:hypothetical protein
MRKFESELKKCLESVEKANVCYDVSLGLQTMQIAIFDKGEQHGVVLINVHCADEKGEREINIVDANCKVCFRERRQVDAEKVLKKVRKILEEDYIVTEKSRYRDTCYWMVDKGVLVIDRKQPNSL